MSDVNFRANSIKLSMMKLPYTIGLFLYTLLPFVTYSCVQGKFGNIDKILIEKIVYVLLSLSIAFVICYYILRFIYKFKTKYKYTKKELILTILFVILPIIALVINCVISVLYVNKNINNIAFFSLFVFTLICSIASSISEFFSKINVLNKVNLDQINEENEEEVVINSDVDVNVFLDKEIVIKKKKE